MTLVEMLDIAKNRLSYLSFLRESAVRTGDAAALAATEADLATTQQTINQLESLLHG